MDSLILFYKKNSTASIVALLLIPIAGALIYGAIKSFWLKSKFKKNGIAVYDFLVKSGADQTAQTTDDIAKALGLPKDEVVAHCSNHPKIVDAGKRQRSWKVQTEPEGKAE